MKNIKRAIEECMVGYGAKESGELVSRFVFPEDFIGFQGHFPGNKILPGICQIQCVISMIEKCRGKRAELMEIVLAKFLSPVMPSEELICTGRNIGDNEEILVMRASFNTPGKKIGEMKLKVRLKEDQAR